ncbi:hypothetical protein F5877DRAFT_55061 [Lentinula edodes]|nr:hypothetical protein F5877DRAFT_55061 [Lentinula edodes]
MIFPLLAPSIFKFVIASYHSLTQSCSDSDHDVYHSISDNERPLKKTRMSGTGTRAKRKSTAERLALLEEDKWISKVVNDRAVKCAGCGMNIRLGKSYEKKNWDKHRSTCPRITLKKTVRTAVKPQVQKHICVHLKGACPAVPCDGSPDSDVNKWTESEWTKVKCLLAGYARWEVDLHGRFIKSTRCEIETYNTDSICDRCISVAKDESFKRAVRKKRREASLSPEERLEKAKLREKYASLTSDRLQKIQRRFVNDILSDRILFDITESLKTDSAEDCFLRLWQHAKDGHLGNHQRVVDICEALDDRVAREASDNPKLICGIRYTQNVINFMMMMRSYGHNSHRQYTMFTSVFGGPTSRHLQTLRNKSVDAMRNPYLIFENVARAKRYYDSIDYMGPVIAASDCTKVKKRLNFSVQFGCHILGTTMPLQMVEVDSAEDIDEIVDQAVKENSLATQVRAVMIKIPLPRCPPIVIALLPTAGKEDADEIHSMHMRLMQMAEDLGLPIIAMVADGAATELSAQGLMDRKITTQPPLVYENHEYGIRLSAPVFKMGPLISVTDAPHARKTARNQPQHGTHTASLGTGYLVNRSLIDIYVLDGAGLMLRDVENVDKQDDGAARRIFHFNVLESVTEVKKEDSSPKYYPGIPFSIHNITTEFVEHFFGNGRDLLENFSYSEFLKIVQHIMVRQRIIESGEVSPKNLKDSASGYLFDSVTDLRIPSSKPIPSVTISRAQIDDIVRIAYQEAVHLCRDILCIPALKTPSPARQPLLHIALDHPIISDSAAADDGSDAEYESGDEPGEDEDEDNLEEDDYEVYQLPDDDDSHSYREKLNHTAGLTAKDTAKYSALCDDLDKILEQHDLVHTDIGLPLPSLAKLHLATTTTVESDPISQFSQIMDSASSKVSVDACLKVRKIWQSATSTKSERTVKLSDKYVLGKVMKSDAPVKKMSPQEGSHRLRIAQDKNVELQQQQKKNKRQQRWLEGAQSIRKVSGLADGMILYDLCLFI